jgi:SpoVK/Ycf46/Vps4 family AAA+-type ATPase
MVDLNTYNLMHSEKSEKSEKHQNYFSYDAMACEESPEAQFLLCLPATIYGFNMQEKSWTNLLVSNIEPMKWDKESFKSLAVDTETKEIITALVTNKIAADEATDVISGKGNGLIVLLHGGPGTGKTLTAESVAELAERPLYRVTCGDIGTTAEEVEKYLKSVLELGKIWNCVVLLDEAEVFLQERSLNDLQRNALVSVFLRVLEYYDGILILTSNRVGTFDEAFKSRIQLALHYEPLKEAQRRKIWENFLTHLEKFESTEAQVDLASLRENLVQLARFKLNGRQIRNVITTARQMALHKRQAVNFTAIKHVIQVSTKFDQYLKKLNEDLDDEEIAREDGRR